jgi:hypothetical protein
MQITCKNPLCGFRVPADYYEKKKRFVPGACARCNSPILIVDDWTDDEVTDHYMVVNPNDKEAGKVKKREA